MKKIIFMGDILYHSKEFLSEQSYCFTQIFQPIIEDSLGNVKISFDIKSENTFAILCL